MRRVLLACLALGTIAAGSGQAAAGPLDVKGTSVGVSEREFRISPYRKTVPPGQVKLNVKNYGEDVHDLVVITPKGKTLGTTGEIGAGDQAVLRVRVRTPGVYRLVCTQADHAARGMKSRLVVRSTAR